MTNSLTATTADLDLVPNGMLAWVLGDPGELTLENKLLPVPATSEVLVRIDAVAICATDLEVIASGPPAFINGGLPFNQGFTPGHEYMGTIAELGPGVDEFAVGDRIAVEIHAGCGQCKRCRAGMYTSCLNYGRNYAGNDKGHRANGFTTQGGFAQYAVNHVNTLVRVPDGMSDAEAALAVTAGTSMYGFTEMGGGVGGRKRGRDRAGADWLAGGCGGKSAGRGSGHSGWHARQPACARRKAGCRPYRQSGGW